MTGRPTANESLPARLRWPATSPAAPPSLGLSTHNDRTSDFFKRSPDGVPDTDLKTTAAVPLKNE